MFLSNCWHNPPSSCLISRKCHGNNLLVWRKTQNPLWINWRKKNITHIARVRVWHDGTEWIVDVVTVTRTFRQILYCRNEGVRGITTNDHADCQNETISCVILIYMLRNILLYFVKIAYMFFEYTIHLYVV